MLLLSLYCKAKALYATRDRGATALEYALLITFVAAAIVAMVTTFGTKLSDEFKTTCNAVLGGSTCG